MLKNQTILLALVSTMLSAGLMACGDDSSNNPQQQGGTGGASTQNFAAPCSNPIPLDAPGLTIARPGQVWQPRNYSLTEMAVSVDNSENNNSFSADAQSQNGFSVQLGCNQVGSNYNMSASLDAPQWFNGQSKQHSDVASVLEVGFTDGVLDTSDVTTGQTNMSTLMAGDDSTSADNQVETGDDGSVSLVSYRLYVTSVNTVELRIKITSNFLTEYGKAVFTAQ